MLPWQHIFSLCFQQEADLAIAPLTITYARSQAIHFSEPFKELGISLMIRRHTSNSSGILSFLYPLSNEVWMSLAFAYIGVSVVLFLVSHASLSGQNINYSDEEPVLTDKFTILNSLWFTFAAFMQQGCDFEPRLVKLSSF